MSAAASHPPAYGPPDAASPPAPARAADVCPLCGAPLRPEQDWCLQCGAAARTRLASAPNWKAPLAVFAAVVVISLGVLAAALVKLAGGSGTPVTNTRTVTAPAAAAATPAPRPAPATTTPAPGAAATRTATAPAAAAPGASTTTPRTGTGSTATTPRATGGVPSLPGIDTKTPGAK